MSRALHRSIAGHIEYWTKIEKIAEENPDVTYEMIKQLLIAREQSTVGNVKLYKFDR